MHKTEKKKTRKLADSLDVNENSSEDQNFFLRISKTNKNIELSTYGVGGVSYSGNNLILCLLLQVVVVVVLSSSSRSRKGFKCSG